MSAFSFLNMQSLDLSYVGLRNCLSEMLDINSILVEFLICFLAKFNVKLKIQGHFKIEINKVAFINVHLVHLEMKTA